MLPILKPQLASLGKTAEFTEQLPLTGEELICRDIVPLGKGDKMNPSVYDTSLNKGGLIKRKE